MTKVIVPSLSETLEVFRSGLRRAITNPTIRGYKPMPIQKQFHDSKAKGKVFLGGNRAGKTVAGGTETVQYMLGEHPNQKAFPVKWRAVGTNWEDGVKKIIMPEIAKWTPPSQLKHGSWEASYDVKGKTLTYENGSTLEFLTNEQEVQAHAGTSRHGVWFDEEPDEDIFNENMLRLVDVGGVWYLTMTPLFEMSWTFERLYQNTADGKTTDIEVFHASTLDNTFIDPTILEILTQGMSPEEKEARKEGTYFNLSGGIYTGSLSQAVFIDPIIDSPRWQMYYDTWGHFGMLDHGYTNLTAFHLGCFDSEGNIKIYFEYTASKKLVRENAVEIIKALKKLGLYNKLEYIVCDPSTRNTDPITRTSVHQEYAEHGLFMIFGDNDVKKGIDRVNAKLKDGSLQITTDNPNLIYELPQYRWDKFVSSKIASRKNLKETPIKRKDHSLDAVRYGVMSRPQLDTEFVQPVGNVLQMPLTASDIDELLARPYKDWDNPEVFDEVLGTDW